MTTKLAWTLASIPLALGCAAEAGAVDEPGRAELDRLAVEAVYERLEEYSEGELSIEVDDFRSIDRAELAALRFDTLLTFPAGDVIDTVRSVRQEGDVRFVRYDATWSAAHEMPEDNPVGSMTAAEVLDRAATGDPDMGSVVRATSYRVRVSLEGRDTVYRALALWMDGDRVRVVDLITQGAEIVAAETVPSRDAAGPPLRESVEELYSAHGARCQAWRDSMHHVGPWQTNRESHFTGYHYAQASFDISCECLSNCTSICDATVAHEACGDTARNGVWSFCHKMTSARSASSQHAPPGVGAACAAGFVCGQKSCFACLCGLSLGVSVSGVDVSFDSTDADWKVELDHSRICPPCTPEDA